MKTSTAESKSLQQTMEEWRNRALTAELEVRDLLKEQQRLQYLIEDITNELSRGGARNKQQEKYG